MTAIQSSYTVVSSEQVEEVTALFSQLSITALPLSLVLENQSQLEGVAATSQSILWQLH